MEFIADYWFIWLGGVVLSAVAMVTGFFKPEGNMWYALFGVLAAFFCMLLFISVLLNVISFAVEKFSVSDLIAVLPVLV